MIICIISPFVLYSVAALYFTLLGTPKYFGRSHLKSVRKIMNSLCPIVSFWTLYVQHLFIKLCVHKYFRYVTVVPFYLIFGLSLHCSAIFSFYSTLFSQSSITDVMCFPFVCWTLLPLHHHYCRHRCRRLHHHPNHHPFSFSSLQLISTSCFPIFIYYYYYYYYKDY